MIKFIKNSKIPDAKPPPTKLRLVLKGEAKRHQGSRAGVYILQKNFVNTYPYWKNKSKEYSIWFDLGNGTWFVGDTKDLGSVMCGIKGPYGEDDWPQNISANWKYSDGTGTWPKAGTGDVVFEDLSNGNPKIDTESLLVNQFSIYQSSCFSDKDCTIS